MTTIRVQLSQRSIQNAIKQMKDIKEWIIERSRVLVKEMAERGVEIADSYTGDYQGYINFTISTEDTPKGGKAIITMSDKQKIIREWRYKGGVKSAEVSPSLMAEYGSGEYAIDGHRGTFPNQTHAFNPPWRWTTLDNVSHTSSGERPTRPMFQAYIKLSDINTISDIIQQVFEK